MSYTHVAAHNAPAAVRLGEAPAISPSAVIRDCRFGRYTQVGEQSRMEDCLLDDYSYLQHYCDLICSASAKFTASTFIAAMVRVNPGFHPVEWPTLHHFTYRRTMFGMGAEDDADFFAWRRRRACPSATTPGSATAWSSCLACASETAPWWAATPW